jgi:hypothetical protein
MFGSRFASSEKVSDLDFGRRSAGRRVGLVQDEDAAVVVAAKKPCVAILTTVNLSLMGHHKLKRATHSDTRRLYRPPPPRARLPTPGAPESALSRTARRWLAPFPQCRRAGCVQRLGMQDELSALWRGDRRDNRNLAAEFVWSPVPCRGRCTPPRARAASRPSVRAGAGLDGGPLSARSSA